MNLSVILNTEFKIYYYYYYLYFFVWVLEVVQWFILPIWISTGLSILATTSTMNWRNMETFKLNKNGWNEVYNSTAREKVINVPLLARCCESCTRSEYSVLKSWWQFFFFFYCIWFDDTFKIRLTCPFHTRFSLLKYSMVLLNFSLKCSLRNPKWFFYSLHHCANPLLNLYF